MIRRAAHLHIKWSVAGGDQCSRVPSRMFHLSVYGFLMFSMYSSKCPLRQKRTLAHKFTIHGISMSSPHPVLTPLSVFFFVFCNFSEIINLAFYLIDAKACITVPFTPARFTHEDVDVFTLSVIYFAIA